MSTDRGSVPPAIVAPDLARAAAPAQPLDDDDDAHERDALEVDRAARHAPARRAPAEDAAAATWAGAGAAGAAAAADAAEAAAEWDPNRPEPPDGLAQRNPPRDWAAPPPWLASDEAKRRAHLDADPPSFLGRRAEPGQGLAGSAADRMAGGSPAREREPEREREVDLDEEWTSAPRPASRRAAPARDDPDRYVEDDDGGAEAYEDEPPRRTRSRPRAYNQHLGGPEGPDWERPRRYEAYPTIRSRVGLPKVRVPSIALMAGAVAILALALFFLPGMLNLGGGAGTRPSASPSSGAVPSASVAPTAPPAPTPVVYTIKKGDTLSKIATANGITVDELLAANPAIKDPNKISLGQQIVIPTPSEAPPDEVGGSSAP